MPALLSRVAAESKQVQKLYRFSVMVPQQLQMANEYRCSKLIMLTKIQKQETLTEEKFCLIGKAGKRRVITPSWFF